MGQARTLAVILLSEAVTGLLVIGFLILISGLPWLAGLAAYLVSAALLIAKAYVYKRLAARQQPIAPALALTPTLALICGIVAGYVSAPEALQPQILETLARDALWLALMALLYGLVAYTRLIETVSGALGRKS
jgi:hypothetical protein